MNLEQDGFFIRYTDYSVDNTIWAAVSLSQTEEGLTAHSYIYGPGRGDECMVLIATRLGQVVGEFGQPVTHIVQATNKGADSLARRTEGYKFVGINKKGHRFYKKTYGVGNF